MMTKKINVRKIIKRNRVGIAEIICAPLDTRYHMVLERKLRRLYIFCVIVVVVVVYNIVVVVVRLHFYMQSFGQSKDYISSQKI